MALVGTVKGAFIYHSDAKRQDWRMTGPHMSGWEVYSLFGDSRRSPRLFAGTSSFVYGPTIRYSDDFGETWTQVENSPAYSKESGFALKRIWQIVPGHESEPETVYAGVEEAGLFVSRDRGLNWTELSGLTSHPSRPKWFPGNGGLCLHTILIDPTNAKRLYVGISAVGAFRSEDGGETWTLCNNGLPQVASDEEMTPEMKEAFAGMEEAMKVSRCVHKMGIDPQSTSTLYMQYHGGVLISRDRGDHWSPIEKGLPSNFGFALGVSSGGDLYVIPLSQDEARCTPGRLNVYRSRDRGDTWHDASVGLPQQGEYVSVLRDAMAVDPLSPAGICFGTTQGDVFYSNDGGDRWTALPGRLPRITTVKSWIVED
jgi:hypothetical protein